MTHVATIDPISDFLCRRVAHMTKLDPAQVTPSSALVEIGLQSIDAVILCGEVEDHFRIELEPATIFEHDTVGSFAREIARRQALA